MRRITIRNLRSQRNAKPRIFDAIIDGNHIFFEIKSGSRGTEIIALDDIFEQIAAAEAEETGPPQDEEILPGA